MDWIQAPEKLLVPAVGAGHYADITHFDELRLLMLGRVRPLGVAAESETPAKDMGRP